MKKKTVTVSALATAIVAIVFVYGCGGGGGASKSSSTTGGRPPFAANPTCSAVEVLTPYVQQIPGGGAPGVLVPLTSVEHASDVGVRVHTNHLILAKSVHSMIAGSQGLTPAEVAGAYGVPGSAGGGAIAIVDAYNYPTALSDFNFFSNNFGLPMETSSNATASSNNTLQVVYASGSQPQNDGGWSQEMAIDIEWAHAMAPQREDLSR